MLYPLLQQSMNLFLVHASKLVVAPCYLINSSIEKDRLVMFDKIVWVGSNPSPRYFLLDKDGGYWWIWCTMCVVIIFLILVSNLFTSLSFESMILKLSVITGISRILIAVILFLAFKSVLRINCVLLTSSFFSFCLIVACWIPLLTNFLLLQIFNYCFFIESDMIKLF